MTTFLYHPFHTCSTHCKHLSRSQLSPIGITEINVTIKDLKDTEVVLSTASPLNSPVWPVKKTDGSWRMTVGYHRTNQIVTLIAAAVPDVVSLLEQMNTSPRPPEAICISVRKPNCIALQVYLEYIVTLQTCVRTVFEVVLFICLFHKIPHWFTILMT